MAGGPLGDVGFLHDIPIELVVELGRTRMTVRELAELAKDDVIELDRLASQPLDILAGGQVFARGEVVVVLAPRLAPKAARAVVEDLSHFRIQLHMPLVHGAKKRHQSPGRDGLARLPLRNRAAESAQLRAVCADVGLVQDSA